MRYLFLLFLLFGSVCSVQAEYALTLLHTNDLHAHLKPFDKSVQDCSKESARCLGGFARLKTIIDQTRRQTPNMLLLDAGDRFSGTLFYTLRKGRDIATLMQSMDYDAMTLGNHEFDDGLEELQRFSEIVSSPLIAANVSFPPDSPLTQRVQPHLIISKGGIRIGLIGLLSEETKTECNSAQEIDIAPPIEAVKREVEHLTKAGVNILVVLSHIGLQKDQQLAREVPQIDVIIGGHSHSFLSNTPSQTEAEGPYPLVIKHPDNSQTLIATAGFGGQYIGQLEVIFNDAGEVIRFQGNPIPLDHHISADAQTEKAIQDIETLLSDIINQPLMLSLEEIGLTPSSTESFCSADCYIGEVLSDILLEAGKKDGADIALINSGGIRSGLPAGQITFGHVIQAYPFTSYGALIELTGAELKNYLTHGLQQYRSTSRTNAFLQVAGAQYTFSESTHQITQLTLTDGRPIDPRKTYRIILPSFLANGGDGFPPQPIIKTYSQSIRDLIVSHLKEHHRPPSPFSHRISAVP